MGTDAINATRLLDILSTRTSRFFLEELGIAAEEAEREIEDAQKLNLRSLTSIMGASGELRLYLAYSFDEPLINRAFEAYASDIEVAEDERDLFVEETAAEIINIIAGNALADYNLEGPVISLSPPIIISEAKHLMRHKSAKFSSARLVTEHGDLNIHLIGPKHLFDQRLEYKE